MEILLYLVIGLIITHSTIHILNKNNITWDMVVSHANDPGLEEIFLKHPFWFKNMLCFIFILEVFLWPLVVLYWIYKRYKRITSNHDDDNDKFNVLTI